MTKLEAEPLPHLQQSQVIRWPRQRLPTNREAAVPSGVGKDSQGWLFELDRETDEKKAIPAKGKCPASQGLASEVPSSQRHPRRTTGWDQGVGSLKCQVEASGFF